MRLLIAELLIIAGTVVSISRAAEPTSIVGTFTGANIRLDLKSADNGTFTGELEFNGQKFPVTAKTTSSGISGTFQSGGGSFDFDASLAGDKLTLRSGGAEYELRRPAANPLAKPPAANPLAGANKPQQAEKNTSKNEQASSETGGKDSIPYKMQDLPGGSIAAFDGWTTQPVMNENNTFVFDTCPQGRQKDFVLRVGITTPSAADLQNFFTVAPQFTKGLLQQLSPSFKTVGEAKKTKCAGDDAIVQEYVGEVNGSKVNGRALYTRRGDVGIVALGLGSDAGFKEFGKSIEIIAGSIKFKESAIEPDLVGSWAFEASSRTDASGGGVLNVNSTRTITISRDGSFTDSAATTAVHDDGTGLAQNGNGGKVVKRGNTLTFHYSNGETWTAEYSVGGGGLKLNGQLYLKQ